jgi:hypothetical protein
MASQDRYLSQKIDGSSKAVVSNKSCDSADLCKASRHLVPRNSVGVTPVAARKARVKALWS